MTDRGDKQATSSVLALNPGGDTVDVDGPAQAFTEVIALEYREDLSDMASNRTTGRRGLALEAEVVFPSIMERGEHTEPLSLPFVDLVDACESRNPTSKHAEFEQSLAAGSHIGTVVHQWVPTCDLFVDISVQFAPEVRRPSFHVPSAFSSRPARSGWRGLNLSCSRSEEEASACLRVRTRVVVFQCDPEATAERVETCRWSPDATTQPHRTNPREHRR